MKIGVLGAADIARRRFLPAVKKCENVELAKIAVSSEGRIKAGQELTEQFGGEVVVGYDKLISDSEIEAVYIPLPPSLHYEWAKVALDSGKHVFVEKPSTIKLEDTAKLVEIAKSKNLAIVENYGFVHHPQTKFIHKLIDDGEIGEIRNIRSAFGFPKRPFDDIRHKASLGGGALLDAGGYTIKAGFEFLGETAEVVTASINEINGYEVDMYGSLTMENILGQTLQASFGMDNFYKCELEVWGSKGFIRAPRFYTAPDGFEPQIIVNTSEGENNYSIDSADQFLLQLKSFIRCIEDVTQREIAYNMLEKQMEQLEYAFDLAK